MFSSRLLFLRSQPFVFHDMHNSISGGQSRRQILPHCAFALPSYFHGASHLSSPSQHKAPVHPRRFENLKPQCNVTRPAVGPPRTTSKRKVALFVGYDGAPYFGFQRNAGVETVSDIIEKALYRAGAISDENFGSLEKVDFTVAARTDKGVCSAGNVIGIKLRFPKDLVDEGRALRKMTDDVNSHLPAHVRVFQTSRVTSSFSARVCCDNRSYEYLLPLNAVTHAGSISDFNDVLQKFQGSHYFHNYTVGKEHSVPPPPQASRFIRYIEADPEPFVLTGEPSKSEWVRVRLQGQSFVLHQIRKMIAMALLVHHRAIPADAIEQSFSRSLLVNCPPAPAVGLFLDFCAFDSYNNRYSDHLATPVGFEKLDEQRERFKQEIIFPSIARRALDGRDMEIFFETVARHAPSFEEMCDASKQHQRRNRQKAAEATNFERP